MRKGKLIAALGVLTLGTLGLASEAAHASQRTTFGEALRDGYEVRALAFVPTEASSRQTGEQTPDAVILTLQREQSVVVCYYTLAAYVSDDVLEIDSCKAHAPEAVVAEEPPTTAETDAPEETEADEPAETGTPDDEAPGNEAVTEEPDDAPAADNEAEETEPDGPDSETEPDASLDETDAQ